MKKTLLIIRSLLTGCLAITASEVANEMAS